MTISATTQGLRPGVTTSSNRPATPFEGQMIYETDTDLTYIYGGSAWQQVSGGTAVGNSGLVYITSATIGSGVSTVPVANAFSTTYDNYLVQVIGTVVSANQPNLGIQLTGTTSGYYYAGFYQAFTSTTLSGDASTTATYIPLASCGNGTAGNGRVSVDVTVKSPYLAQATFFSALNSSITWNSSYTGQLNNSTQYTGFTILPSSGTLTGGTIAVYGYRKA